MSFFFAPFIFLLELLGFLLSVAVMYGLALIAAVTFLIYGIADLKKAEPEIIYKGKRLHIYFPDSLLMDQTYIISINRDLTDEHRVNLSQGVQVAFSTGSEIDRGIISGTVQYSKDASLNLWKVQNDNDHLKFYQRVPDYVIDASSEGYYEFNLVDGRRFILIQGFRCP